MNKIQSFFYGIISAFGAMFFQQIILFLFNIEIIDTSRLTPILIFGIISEEFFKFIVIYKISKDSDNQRYLILNSVLAGFGFALVEFIFKIWDNIQNFNLNLIDYSLVIIIHILTAGLIGFFLKTEKISNFRIIFAIISAIFLHFIYNYLRIYVF